MMHKTELSREQLDFLREMMNIGAGNAGTALEQMLNKKVDVVIPRVHFIPSVKTTLKIFANPSKPVLCARMAMIGDATGHMFFLVPDEHKEMLTHLLEEATYGHLLESDRNLRSADLDLSVLTEVASVLAGVYLTAIHDFCKLNIYHSVPSLAIDMIQSLLDESISVLSHKVLTVIAIENQLIVGENRITIFLLMIPAAKSVSTLINSIAQAKIAYEEC